MQTQISDERLLSRAEVAEHFGLTIRHLEDLASKGEGPRFSRFGRMIRYRAGDVRSWICSHQVRSEDLAASSSNVEGKQMQASTELTNGEKLETGSAVSGLYGTSVAADLPLRILRVLRADSNAGLSQVSALIEETDTACDKLAMLTVEIQNKRNHESNALAPKQRENRQRFEEVRSLEFGLNEYLGRLRELASTLAA